MVFEVPPAAWESGISTKLLKSRKRKTKSPPLVDMVIGSDYQCSPLQTLDDLI
ncbi:hypothetical protein [Cupriavidus pinatubonensis]|uniref:hypothetical protein n=1 Tax=Cupriavidus pinatubonensis TaxID=248026 RepID=UPI001CC33C1A|nr:hypothetical protein [Cupriavidus pinatubonensis]